VDAIAFAPKRDVVIVQDVSGSMKGSPIAQAINADQTLVGEMRDQRMPGDRVGVVAFASDVSGTPLPLTILAGGGASTVTSHIGGLSAGGGTNIPSGIEAGIDMFSATGPAVPEVDRIMILVGDGGDGNQSTSEGLAATAGDDTHRINFYTIYFATGNNNCQAQGAAYLQSLPQRRGYFRCAPTPQELTQIMADIVTGIPMRVVQ
jgi:Mg-chelatase subunit ChlD